MDEFVSGKGEFMEGVTEEGGRNGSKILAKGGIEEEEGEEALAKEEAQDEGKVFASARELESAITALLQLRTRDPNQQILANQWLSQFVTQPFAWTAALYVAFPPAHLGTSMEVRYFTLNILLGKIRSDWIQLGSEDALEMYETLLRQVPSNLDNPWFASRLLVLVSAASVVAGEQAALQLVQNVLGAKPIVEGPLVYELLTALAEEIFVSSREHSVEVVESMRDISPEVLQFLEDTIKDLPNSQGEAQIFTCLERWINSGFTLSELYSTYPNLLKALFRGIGSLDDGCFDAAVSALSEFIAAVDLLPDREAAIRVTISAILAQQGLYAAASSPGGLVTQSLLSRSRGLVILITVVASSEASLLARGGPEASSLLDWLVDATGGGGGLGIEGATIAAVAWPRLAAVPATKCADVLQASRFAAAAQAVLQAETYTADLNDLEKPGFEEDELFRYREGAGADALTAFYGQLGTTFLSHLLVQLREAVTWQPAEVCLYTMAILSSRIKASAGLSAFQVKITSSEVEQVAARSFLSAVFVWVSASTPANEQDLTSWKSWRLVQTTLLVVENFAEWTAIDLKSLEAGMKYAMGALRIHNVRGNAAKALGELCRAAAPHIVAAQALGPVFGSYELALSASDRLEASERIAFVEGLAVISSALPPVDAEAAVNSLTGTVVSTIKAVAEMRAKSNVNGQVLAEELRVLAAVVTYGAKEGANPALHPALPILHGIWPSLDVVAGHWAGDADVVTALCELWGTIASRLGIVLSAVLPSVIKSATAMYKQHLVPACLDCVSNIVLLASSNTNISPEVDEYLLATLLEVTDTLVTLEQIVKSKRGPDWNNQIGREVEQEDIQQQNAEAALFSISKLARSFLHSKPYTFLTSTAFQRVIPSVIGSIQRKQVESSLAGARLLSEIILCLSFSDDDFKGKVTWQLPEDLVPHVDQMVGLYGTRVVEVVLRTLAESQLVEPLRDALADVLYGLCMRYPGETEVIMGITLSGKDFPARKGVLKESDKRCFISAATKHPVQPRRRFQELISNFSQVCRGAVPAQVLTAYQ